MAKPYKYSYLNIDIRNLNTTPRSFISRMLGEGDKNGDKYCVRIFDEDSPVNISDCSVVGYFVRQDGTTVVVEGQVLGGDDHNIAVVTLPSSCYAVTGQFTLSIKVTGTNFSGTVWIIDGTVTDTSTNTYVDPGSVISSLNQTLVERAEDAAAIIGHLSTSETQIEGDRYKCSVTLTS